MEIAVREKLDKVKRVTTVKVPFGYYERFEAKIFPLEPSQYSAACIKEPVVRGSIRTISISKVEFSRGAAGGAVLYGPRFYTAVVLQARRH